MMWQEKDNITSVFVSLVQSETLKAQLRICPPTYLAASVGVEVKGASLTVENGNVYLNCFIIFDHP